MEGLPPVDPRNLEAMRDIWNVIKVLGPAAIAGGLVVLREWAKSKRLDRASGVLKPRREGRPNYKK